MPRVQQNSTGQPWAKPGHGDRGLYRDPSAQSHPFPRTALRSAGEEDQTPTGPRGARPQDRLRAWWVRVAPPSDKVRGDS